MNSVHLEKQNKPVELNLTVFNWTNDLPQIHIYNEMRDKNNVAENYRHFLGVLGSLISVVGVFGKIKIYNSR